MGLLVDGVWQDRWYDTAATGGRFVRQDSRFRNWITVDGSPGPTGEGGFPARCGRYHLYVSLACPWAHRTLIVRRLEGLDDAIGVSVVHWLMREHGWTFDLAPGATGDRLAGRRYLHEVYTTADPTYTGRVTVPVLWDTERRTIVSNESADIIRMLDTAFDGLGAKGGDLQPEALRGEIDRVNARVYDAINNGVYKAGFATEQVAYDEAVSELFRALDDLEAHVRHHRFLVGERLTLADVRLFTTLVRFDAVYVGHFKCNLRRLADYPGLSAYLARLWALPAFRETTDFVHVKGHYYQSHRTLNPSGIVPLGPDLPFAGPTGVAPPWPVQGIRS